MTSFNPLDLLLSPAYAQAGQAPQGGGLSFLLMPIVLIAVMSFLLIRPHMKPATEPRAFLATLPNGAHVITNPVLAAFLLVIALFSFPLFFLIFLSPFLPSFLPSPSLSPP